MDKSFEESKDGNGGDDSATTSTTTTTKDEYLRHLNKISHKISKQSTFFRKPPPPPPSLTPSQNHQQQQFQQHQLQQNQPPVYNINKSDFRDVVQKLTGSPLLHHRFNTPPPIHPPKPHSSRLHRIRPPPLAQFSKIPPTVLNSAVPSVSSVSSQVMQRPLSPLPPFPSVHLAAESPVSAYLRSISAVDSDPSRFSGFSPLIHQPAFQIAAPPSPIPFGCLPSPRSGSLCSPTSGQLGFPVSPKVPVDSPRWRDVV